MPKTSHWIYRIFLFTAFFLVRFTAEASICPRLLYEAGIATIDTGITYDTGNSLFSKGMEASETESFFSLTFAEYQLMRLMQHHCKWLSYRTHVPYFRSEHRFFCSAMPLFQEYLSLWDGRKTLIGQIRALRTEGGTGIATEASVKELKRRLAGFNAPLFRQIEVFRREFRNWEPRFRAVMKVWHGLTKDERRRLVRGFNYVGFWAIKNDRSTDFAAAASRDPHLKVDHDAMVAFDEYVLSHERGMIPVWAQWELYGNRPVVTTRDARKLFSDALDGLAQPQSLDAWLFNLRNPAAPAAVAVPDFSDALLLGEAPGDDGTKAPERPRLVDKTKPPAADVPAAAPSRLPTSLTKLHSLATRARWLQTRKLTESRRKEAERLAPLLAVYDDWNETAELRMGVIWSFAALERAGSDPQTLQSTADLAFDLDEARQRMAATYWAVLADIDARILEEDAAFAELPPQARRRVEDALIELDEASSTQNEAIVDSFDAFVDDRSLENKLRLFASFRIRNPKAVQRTLDLTISTQTGGGSQKLASLLAEVYQRMAVSRKWKFEQLTGTQGLAVIRVRITGVGVESFAESEIGIHTVHADNDFEGNERKKGKVFTSTVRVTGVLNGGDGERTLDQMQQTRMYEFGKGEVSDRRLEPSLMPNFVTWTEFFRNGGIEALRFRLDAQLGLDELGENKRRP